MKNRPTEKCETIYGIFHSWSGDLFTAQLKQYSAHTRNEVAGWWELGNVFLCAVRRGRRIRSECRTYRRVVRAEQHRQRIGLIKIDTEGSEVAVLRACRKLICRDVPIIYAEINRRALARFGNSVEDVEVELDSFGYDFFKSFFRKQVGGSHQPPA